MSCNVYGADLRVGDVLQVWFGHWQSWLLILTAWGGLGLLTALALGVIARVGTGRRQR